MGVGNGTLFMAFYASYGLAFWYGTKQVRDGFAPPYDMKQAVFCAAFEDVPAMAVMI